MRKIPFENNTIYVTGYTIITPYKIKEAWFDEKVSMIYVLMDPNSNLQSPQFRNLVSYTLNNMAAISWVAELPTCSGPDCYMELNVEDKQISAFSFSCFRCKIDKKTGKIIEKKFTK